jgi:hypothetical protein
MQQRRKNIKLLCQQIIAFSFGATFPYHLLLQKVKVFFNENNTNFCVSDIIKFSKETLGFRPQAGKK